MLNLRYLVVTVTTKYEICRLQIFAAFLEGESLLLVCYSIPPWTPYIIYTGPNAVLDTAVQLMNSELVSRNERAIHAR